VPGEAPHPDLGVLGCRIAGELAQHEPGWRLPRFSVLARRFGVTPEQVAAAVRQLAGRQLVRQQPNGQFIRRSPAEYHIPLSPPGRIRVVVTPFGGRLACRTGTVGRQVIQDDIAWALGASAGAAACVLRLQFTVGDEPAAVSRTFVAAAFRPYLDELLAAGPAGPLPVGPRPNGCAGPAAGGQASRSVQVELQQPAPGVASLLHLAPGDKVIAITARADDRSSGGPAALTVAALRPDMFTVAIESADQPLPVRSADCPPADLHGGVTRAF
jgi:DNA-binding GntR family transcriptional regulator